MPTVFRYAYSIWLCLQDVEMLDLEDYRHNFVNLTGFRLVDVEDSFTKSILYDIQLFRENTNYKILNGTSLPVSRKLLQSEQTSQE